MLQPRTLTFFRAVLSGWLLLAFPIFADAQRHGGTPSAGEGGLSAYSRPDGVDEKDSLKDFHHAMEVQATGAQVVQFQSLVKSTETVKAKLREYLQPGNEKGTAEPARASVLAEGVESARSEAKKFVEGFSDQQKSGLKEATKRLEKADIDLELEEKKLNQNAQGTAGAGPRSEGMDKALTEFSNQQLALGREMGIILANGQDSTFTLPAVKSTARIADHAVEFTSAGQLSQVAIDGNRRTFKLQLTSDLSDLQQKITELVRAEVNRSDRCGERVAVQQAMLTPSTPAGVLFVRLHYERWICPRVGSQSSASEIAESNGSVELRLTPAWGKSGVEISSQFGRIEGGAMMTDAIRQGGLGDDLRDAASHLLIACIQAGTDLKTPLPAAVQGDAVVQDAKFADGGAGRLFLVVEGRAQLSDEQASLLARQLNQAQLSQAQSNQAMSTKTSGAQ